MVETTTNWCRPLVDCFRGNTTISKQRYYPLREVVTTSSAWRVTTQMDNRKFNWDPKHHAAAKTAGCSRSSRNTDLLIPSSKPQGNCQWEQFTCTSRWVFLWHVLSVQRAPLVRRRRPVSRSRPNFTVTGTPTATGRGHIPTLQYRPAESTTDSPTA